MKYYAISVILLILAGCEVSTENSPVAKKPNVILFVADDLGWTDLGIQGSDYYQTPNIDLLAKEGMRFTNAYANAPNCAPSRACLISGLYTPRHGIYTVSNPDRGQSKNRKIIPTPNQTVLDTNFRVLPQRFKEKGYSTAMAGKWHLSDDARDYGFDENFGGYRAGAPRSYFSPYKNPNLSDGPDDEYLPERLAEESKKWISDHASEPFFFYYPFYLVHTPIQPKKELEEKYKKLPAGAYHHKPDYAAMVEAMDITVGEIMTLLKLKGIDKNTIVIFTSDNGPMGAQSIARPLRGSKGMLYEGGIRVPFIFKWSGVVAEGSICDKPIIGLDIMPTLDDIIHNNSPIEKDGVSIMPLLLGKEMEERAIYWHFPAYLQMYHRDKAFEDSHDKPYFRTSPAAAIRMGDWKLLEFFEDGDLELYNLRDDIGEQNNLANKETKMRDSLYRQMLAWRKKVNAPVPTDMNPDFMEENAKR